MPCDSRPFRRNQSLSERKAEVKKVTDRLSKGLATGKYKTKVGPQGGVTFTNADGSQLSAEDRAGVTDGCAYRRLMKEGSTAAKMAIERAEQLAGRKVDQDTVAKGVHSHDGGTTWHDKD